MEQHGRKDSIRIVGSQNKDKESVEKCVEKVVLLRPASLIPENKTYDVMLIGYLRGGTTFLGEVLGFRRVNFYIYEPLNTLQLWGHMDNGVVCYMNNNTCSNKTNMTDDTFLNVMRGIYNCDSQKYQHVLQPWQYSKSIGLTQRNRPVCHQQDLCFNKYLNECPTAVSKVSKVPRLSIGLALKLLHEFPNLKIIHLFRDPRAILNSRDKARKAGWWATFLGTMSLCEKMRTNIRESSALERVYPKRIYTVFYENLVQNVSGSIAEIYKFLGYSFDEKEKFRLKEMTQASTDGKDTDTRRRNSALTAREWRNNIDIRVLDETNTACSDIYQRLGYPQLNNEIELRNISIPLRVDNQHIHN
ncbi:carbohydrate sulfotransferase 1-like [Argopecten irradians]|uniref:carbohydrate sulfotransferase 1-like n=1 Tax=Argopecten irradians TaxID=31199 RepID=UPI003721B96C